MPGLEQAQGAANGDPPSWAAELLPLYERMRACQADISLRRPW